MIRVLLAVFVALLWCGSVSAAPVRTVPPGNRHATQPKIPGGAVQRTRDTKSSFDAKYGKIRDLLAGDRLLIGKIKTTAAAYGIDPVHMIGAIVGEHTYNVDAFDYLQTYYVQAVSYAGSSFRFAYRGETVSQFLTRPEFEACAAHAGNSYMLWTCREEVWDRKFKGRQVGDTRFPADRFAAVFFQPFFAGQTFGLGQESPLMALAMSDMVAATSGYPKLGEDRASEVYEAIMNPDKSLAYMAAAIRHAIDDYRTIARVDISGNPGITATLYNVGRSSERARTLAAGAWPEENYFGWLVNDRLPDLRALLDAPAVSPPSRKTATIGR